MRVITEKRLKEAWQIYPDAEKPLRSWYTIIKAGHFHNLVELRQKFASADSVGRLTVFNIAGNKYRLIVRVEYQKKLVFVRSFLTHAEYSTNRWKNDSWF